MKNNKLTGTYRLISWENHHDSGRVSYPLGPDAKGLISYSHDGFVFVHIMANQRARHTLSDLFGGDPDEITSSATTHISYCGTYEIKGREVIHHVSISSFPNWVPSEQRRNWEFENGKLSLSAYEIEIGNEKVDAHLIWQKAVPGDEL